MAGGLLLQAAAEKAERCPYRYVPFVSDIPIGMSRQWPKMGHPSGTIGTSIHQSQPRFLTKVRDLSYLPTRGTENPQDTSFICVTVQPAQCLLAYERSTVAILPPLLPVSTLWPHQLSPSSTFPMIELPRWAPSSSLPQEFEGCRIDTVALPSPHIHKFLCCCCLPSPIFPLLLSPSSSSSSSSCLPTLHRRTPPAPLQHHLLPTSNNSQFPTNATPYAAQIISFPSPFLPPFHWRILPLPTHSHLTFCHSQSEHLTKQS